MEYLAGKAAFEKIVIHDETWYEKTTLRSCVARAWIPSIPNAAK